MRELDGGRAYLCACGHLARPDGSAAAVGERVNVLRDAARGAIAHVTGAVVETAQDLQSSLEGAIGRTLDRIHGPEEPEDR